MNKTIITLDNAIAVASSIAQLAGILGGGQPDRVKAAFKKLSDVVSADWPADSPVTWAAITEHADAIIARGAAISARIDA